MKGSQGMESIKVLGHFKREGILITRHAQMLLVLAVVGFVVFALSSTATAQTSTESLVYASGFNGSGRLGDETSESKTSPVPVSVGKVVAVDSGAEHSLALKSDGTVWAWGYGGLGELGNGSNDSSSIPVQVSGLTDMVAVSAGSNYSLAVKSDGTVWAWGVNESGQLGNGSTSNRSTPVRVSNLTGVSDVSAGGNHSLALKSDGTVWSWGNNLYGQLGNGSTTQSSTPVQVRNLTGVSKISAGAVHNLALKSDGTVWAWGWNEHGELGNGTTSDRLIPVQVSNLTGVSDIAAGYYHSLALKLDGTVRAWGYNDFGQLGNGSTSDRLTPDQVSDLTGVSEISAGSSHSLAVKSDGTVSAWGNNSYGQLGDGTTTGRYYATPLSDISNGQGVSAGGSHSLFLTALEDIQPDAPTFSSTPTDETQTSINSLTFTGSAEPRSLVKLYDGGTLAGSYRVPAAGSTAGKWTITTQGTLPEGVHRFTATATDYSENTSPVSETRTVTIDRTAPTSRIELGAGGFTNDNKPAATFSGTDNFTDDERLEYSYSVDNGTWSVYSSTKTVTLGGPNGFSDGVHSISLRTRDLAGNVDETGVTRTFEVDTIKPNGSFSDVPNRPINDNTPTFGFSGTDGGNTSSPNLVYSYRVDGGQWSEYSSAKEATLGGSGGLSDGDHTIELRVRDRAGNEDPTPASYTFTIDTTAPTVTNLSGPPSTYFANDATFRFSSEDGATFQCSLDGESMKECSSPKTIEGLTNGSHTFKVRATDKVGNVGQTRNYSWTVNTNLPNTQITSTPQAITRDGNATFGFSSTRSSEFQCSLDGEGFRSCESPRSYFGLASGTHTFKVKAIDVPGNETPATYTWTIDTTKPVITPLSPKANSSTTDTTPTIKASVKDGTRGLAQGGKVGLSVGGKAIAPSKFAYNATNGSLTYNSPKLTKGKKQVKITATDAAGNTTSKAWFFTIK